MFCSECGAKIKDTAKFCNAFIPSMSALFNEYVDVAHLQHIGFPENWGVVMRK